MVLKNVADDAKNTWEGYCTAVYNEPGSLIRRTVYEIQYGFIILF